DARVYHSDDDVLAGARDAAELIPQTVVGCVQAEKRWCERRVDRLQRVLCHADHARIRTQDLRLGVGQLRGKPIERVAVVVGLASAGSRERFVMTTFEEADVTNDVDVIRVELAASARLRRRKAR